MENKLTIDSGIIQIIGVSGVGKTAVASLAADRLGISFIDFADLIIQSAKSAEINAKSHDDILKLPPKDLDRCVNIARTSLVEMARKKVLILETYLAPNRGALGYTFTTTGILQSRNTLGIALILDTPNNISMKRCVRAALRDKQFPYNQLDSDQLVNFISGVVCCQTLNIPFAIIFNEYGKLDGSVNQLTNFVIELGKIRGNSL